jgi:hypothetical protein
LTAQKVDLADGTVREADEMKIAQRFSAGSRQSQTKAREAGDRYRTANGSERVKGATFEEFSTSFSLTLNLYPARYRSRFCNSVVRFTDLRSFRSHPSAEAPGYFHPVRYRERSRFQLF